MTDSITVFQAVTMAVASIGAVLGTMNTWISIDKNRVKLSLIPKEVRRLGASTEEETHLSFDIINFSSFPIIISEIGVLYKNSKNRGYIFPPKDDLPKKIEHRESYSIGVTKKYLNPLNGNIVKCIYLKTDCGVMIKGTSKALKSMVDRIG